MPLATDIPPTPGEIVRARSRRYLVEGVTPAPEPGDQTLVRLSCLEDDAEGEELEVLWEKEVDAQRIDTADWTKLARGQRNVEAGVLFRSTDFALQLRHQFEGLIQSRAVLEVPGIRS